MCSWSVAFSQQLNRFQIDSLYNKFIALTQPELITQTFPVSELTLEDKKCGFQIVTDAKSNFGSFSPEQQANVQKILSRPVLQTSVVSPSGFFRIHYDETGSNRPSYNSSWSVEQNVNEVARALDSVYRFEVGYLGFLPPVGDNGAGGDDKYDVYINDQNGGLYGYTDPESRVGQVNWTSFIVIDNDYTGYYSSGINGMLVTVAHEFHHSIQLGNYSIPPVAVNDSPYRDEDVFFYELTSTSMEEFVFDSVNDYYAYMQSYFSSPYRAMPNQNGYNLAIWNLYLQNKFEFGILKRQWEIIPSLNAILAINKTLLDEGSSFQVELNKFAIWTYYTNVRTIPGLYFEEAANYPLIVPTFIPPQQSFDATSKPTANNFIKFTISGTGDVLYALITNGDASAALQNPIPSISYSYTLYSNPTSGQRELTSQYSSTFSTGNTSFWSVSEILNNEVVRSDSILIKNIEANSSFVFPNPFRYSVSNIIIRLGIKSGTEVDFQVYSAGMKLVYSTSKYVSELNYLPYIDWDGLDNNKNKLASGVYIYVIKHGDEVIKGKVVIFNE